MYAVEADVYEHIEDQDSIMIRFICVDTMHHMLNVGLPDWGLRRMDTDNSYWYAWCPPSYTYEQVEVIPAYALKDPRANVAYARWDKKKLKKGFCHHPRYKRSIPLRATLNVHCALVLIIGLC